MPKIYRDGTAEPVDETDNPVALAYYRREEGYTVDEDNKKSTRAKPKTGTSRGGSRGAGTPPKGDDDPSGQGNGEPPS